MAHHELADSKPSLIKGTRAYIRIPGLNTIVTTEEGEIPVIESLGISMEKSATQVYNKKGDKVPANRYKFTTEIDYDSAQQALKNGKFPEEHRSKLAF